MKRAARSPKRTDPSAHTRVIEESDDLRALLDHLGRLLAEEYVTRLTAPRNIAIKGEEKRK